MLMSNIPSFEERPLIHSETVFMDLTHIGTNISESALRQLSNAKVKLENIIAPGAFVAQYAGPNVVQDINLFRQQLLMLKPTYDQELIEHYNYNLMHGMVVNLNQEQFINLVYDTVFKVYHTYNFFFCNFYVDIKSKCNVLGFPNVDLIIHLIDTQHTVGKLSIGCYAK